MTKYRVREYDVMADIWVLEERFMLFFWRFIGAGKEAAVREMMGKLNG